METGRDSALANTATQTGNRHLHTPKMKDLLLIAPRWQKPSQILSCPQPHLQAPTLALVPASNTNASTSTQNCVSNAFDTTFRMPARIKLDQFDGSDWATWLGILEAILTLHEAEDLLRFIDAPTISLKSNGDCSRAGQRHTYAYMSNQMYTPHRIKYQSSTFKDKWDNTTGHPMVVPPAAQLFSICGDNSHKCD